MSTREIWIRIRQLVTDETEFGGEEYAMTIPNTSLQATLDS